MTEQISSTELSEINALVHGKDMAIGGAYDGARRFDHQLASWNPGLQSADMDILPEKDTLDARSREVGRNDSYVKQGETIHKDSVVGHFFMLNAKPMASVLGRDEAWALAFQEEVEAKFTLWAESPMKWVDAARQNDLTSMLRLAVGTSVFGGEILATAEYIRDRRREYRTAIQMVDPDRLTTPYTMTNINEIRGGIRHDRYGGHNSAFIRTHHPMDYRILRTGEDWWKEVPFRKPWGREQVIFIREQRRVDQTRAVSTIVSGLREIAITRKFRDITLQNAVVNAMYAATIESELPSQAVFDQLGANGSVSDGYVDYATDFLAAMQTYAKNAKGLRVDGVKIPHLFPGTKLHMQPAGNPGGVGQDFEDSLLRYIAATLDVSYEELSKDFKNANYATIKAAISGTHKHMRSVKRYTADTFATSVYRLWIEEAINNDRLDTFRASDSAMLYTNGYQNMMFDALTTCSWIGAGKGQLDELKETQAAVLRIKYGLSTHEDELAVLGKDWRKVYAQLERERNERDDRGIILYEDNSVNAASGSPREDEDDGTGASNRE